MNAMSDTLKRFNGSTVTITTIDGRELSGTLYHSHWLGDYDDPDTLFYVFSKGDFEPLEANEVSSYSLHGAM